METHDGKRVIFILTEEDVKGVAQQNGIPSEQITDGMLEDIKNGVEWGLECWHDVVRTAIDFAFKSADDPPPAQQSPDELELMRRLGK